MSTLFRLARRMLPVLLVALLAAPPAAAQIVRNFTPRFTANDNGDILPIGNTLMSCSGAGCANARNGTGGNLNNNDFSMQYVDVDGDATTFCSSRATLTMPPGATVLWAGLYWGGFSGNAARNQARFATPVAGYVTLTATQLDASGSAYQGFINVTARVIAGGNGTYAVANVRSTTGSNNYAGWSLVVVYRDPAASSRNLVVFDGFAQVAPGATVTIPVAGFVSPPAGVVNTRLGVVAYEGDLGFTGDSFSLNGVALADAANPATNFFNSSISRGGVRVTTKTPNYVNQLGFDIDLLSLTNAIPNGATSATITLSSVSDRYYPGAVTFATDLYAPTIGGNSFTKVVADLDGAPARPGDVLEYTISILNTGQDAAAQTVLRDTLPANATFVPGSIVIASGPNPGTKSDAPGDDQGEYDAVGRRVVVRLGAGANAASGGTLAPSAGTSLRFRVAIGSPAPNGSLVSNQAGLSFNGAQLGTPFTSRSDGDTTVAGSQPTVVTVSASQLSGRVFEDVSYGGGAGRSLAAAGGVPRPGARVELYRGSGAYLAADTTDAAGIYNFDGWALGAYTVRVVNATVTSSRPGAIGTLVPVQTFRTDAAGGSVVPVTDRVGGEIPARADAAANTTGLGLAALTTATTTAQSVAPVTWGSASLSGLDFGFNFDLIVNANDAGQGSLRQFILNANALGNSGLAQVGQAAGSEATVFMVSDGAAHPGLRAGLPSLLTGGVVAITPLTALPALTDAGTRIDGTTQTVNVGDTNAGVIGVGGTVGVDALALAQAPRPEVELRDGSGLGIGLSLQATNLAVTGFAISGFGDLPDHDAHANVLIGAAAAGALVERNVLGSSANAFGDPGAALRSGGDNLRIIGGDGGIARDNLIGFAVGTGIRVTSGSNGWQIAGNEIRGNAVGQGAHDGIAIAASGTATVRGNLVTLQGGVGIDAQSSTGGNVVENNTVTRNGQAGSIGTETAGLRLGGAGNRADRNLISENFGAGVLAVSTAGTNTLTRNSMFGNGSILNGAGGGPSGQIGIDLLRAGDDEAAGTSPFVTLNDNGDGDSGANGLLNFPVLESAVLANGSFTVTGWARPGSTIELFVAEPDPSGFGEGRTLVATFVEGSAGDLDGSSSGYSGAINGLNQGSDVTNRFRFTQAAPPGLVAGTTLTATATLALSTSEFCGLVRVGGGVAVTGVAYSDLDHDFNRDAGELGIGVATYAKLVSTPAPLSAMAVSLVDPATGAYSFTFVPSGTYSIVLDDNPTPGDVAPTPPSGWIVTEAAPGLRSVVVAASDLSDQDFGLWNGSRVDGTVFRDDGAGAGIANDGARQPGEAGIAGVRVRLLSGSCVGGACDSTLSGGGGDYRLWLPAAAVGSAVQVVETGPAQWISTGGSAGNTGGAYARPIDATTFLAALGVLYTGVNFGDVPPNQLVPSGARSGAPGAVVFHPHTFTAGSSGTVTFTTAQTPSPAIGGWAATVYRDLDCDGVIDAGEPVASGPAAVTSGQAECLVLRHSIPAGAPSGAFEQVTLTASFAYAGATPALSGSDAVVDLTTVVGGGGLEIVKIVDVATARPGDFINYTITYRNLGADPLTSIVIHDSTPAFTSFDSAMCGATGAGLAGCAVTTAPAPGGFGPLEWSLSGALAPGGVGTVSFRVRVQ
ncbi:MAG TPA: right-handed parallel beta-helix repeat-containing protein [Candidatus Limnocylindria bacterium]|nr:right-handed parallel beta-helix repeat-containing protein [Candidatus Limnocylindria bacterium]